MPIDSNNLSFWVKLVLIVLQLVMTQTGRINLTRSLYQRYEEHI